MTLKKVVNVVSEFSGSPWTPWVVILLVIIFIIVSLGWKYIPKEKFKFSSKLIHKYGSLDQGGVVALVMFILPAFFIQGINYFNKPFIENQISTYVTKHYVHSSNKIFKNELISQIHKYKRDVDVYEDSVEYDDGYLPSRSKRIFLNDNNDWISKVPAHMKLGAYLNEDMKKLEVKYDNLLKQYDSEWVK